MNINVQSIINKLYRYPKAELAKMNRFGGYFEHERMIRNKLKMTEASLFLPHSISYADGLPLYFLTGVNYLDQTLFCIHSLKRTCDTRFKFILIDDGSFTLDLVTRIHRQLPGVVIFGKREIEINLNKYLPENKYPVLRQKRREYAHIKKLTDIHTLPGPNWKLVLDSDMLFFREPTAITNWLENPRQPIHLVDSAESYGYSTLLMEQLSGHPIPELLNVGIIGLNSQAIDWSAMEKWIKKLEEKEGGSYYLEQALSAMLVAGKDCLVLESSQYVVNPIPQPSNEAILHHYVDLSKKYYYNEAWKKMI